MIYSRTLARKAGLPTGQAGSNVHRTFALFPMHAFFEAKLKGRLGNK